MSTAVMNMISKLNRTEKDQVVDYVQYLISKRKRNSLQEGYKAFYSMREEAKRNGIQGMTLDEINEEIRIARKERRFK